MTPTPTYTEYHPKWHRRRVSTWWWLGSGAYLRFILRELSSAFIAWFVALTLAQIYTLRRGPEAYAQFQAWLRQPWVVALNVATLSFVTYHAVTWFNLAPKAMVVHWRGRQVPGQWVAGANYLGWLVATAVVLWILL
jgi:succinate dehydrogenase subunit C